jgi:hypothetical protein
MLKLASVGVFLSLCKFTYFGFLRKKRIEAREAPLTMTIPMIIVASLCVLGGIYPNLLGNILPYQSEFHVYTLAKLADTMLFSGVAMAIFFFGHKLFIPHRRIVLDFDYVYVRLARSFIWFCRNPASVFASWIDLAYARLARGFLWFCRNPVSSLATGVDVVVAFVVRAFVGGDRYSPVTTVQALSQWIDRLSQAAERASTRRMQREEMAAETQGKVDVRSIDLALFLVALMLAIMLVFLAVTYLL